MAISVVTRPEQGYTHQPGNILEAATGALALYNLPQQMKLQMQRAQLENKGLQQQQNIAGGTYAHELANWNAPTNIIANQAYDPNNPNAGGTTQISDPSKLGGDGLMEN